MDAVDADDDALLQSKPPDAPGTVSGHKRSAGADTAENPQSLSTNRKKYMSVEEREKEEEDAEVYGWYHKESLWD